ncbi:glycoside hydrolase family 3 N-terminal domain-containing protein [Pseudooceanicola sp.]|uniref:glycoside hydrolase family 3 N-terminal domain-containing protein n=1 Tax=Pseudooceanicola sp. TaxID=1914328 RepID=UPI00261E36EA|nr:glycoside hydrolase family 3 N-terminal domain-containing protein [Pseudooceanicola sp.]MDF1854730.1 glycoside hydrolase family 3 N-terminal domain-containing protein [Pseudooceanicola sp.]
MAFGATILDAEGLRLSAAEKALFREADPFGFILFARNIDSPDQVRALTAEMRDSVGRDVPILIDQEGGRVQRLRPPHWRDWLPPLAHVTRAGLHADEAMYLRYRLIADELRAIGVDCNCAPLVDLASEATHPFLKNRCYGTDPEEVAAIGRVVAEAHLAGGVLPVVKHIPGHGRAVADSHLELPVVDISPLDWATSDAVPFRALNDLPLGMTAHITYPAWGDAPATLNAPMIESIRQDLGFDGLLMTDDISMKALAGPPADLAAASLAAGCDVVLLCNADLATRRAVVEASGRMSAAAQTRAERAMAARRTPDAIDIPAMEAKLEALLNGRLHG